MARSLTQTVWLATVISTLAGAQQLPFKVEMLPARLSNHQRLKSTIFVKIDGKELAKRKGQGRLDTELEIVDRQGHRFRSRGSVAMKDVTPENKRPDVLYSQDFLVTPGNYTAYVSVGDTASGEGGAARHTFYVPPLTGDPLPRSWRGLPAIEFLPPAETPDRWFQPSLNGRLTLPVDSLRPVKLDVIVNTTPTESRGVSGGINDLNMETLIPALKAMTQVDLFQGTIDVTLLNLTRRRVIFSQSGVRDLNWNDLRESLRAADPNVVDVQSLANREQRVEFFLSQVSRKVQEALEPDEPQHILVVLSGPMVFEDKVSLHPITTTGNENCKVFYIRYAWGLARPDLLAPVVSGAIPAIGGRTATGAVTSASAANRRPPATIDIPIPRTIPRPNPQDDDLEATLKPLKPKLFHVESPMAFRRALAELLAEISKM